MAFGQWMIIEFTPEQLLQLELEARSLLNAQDDQQVRALAASVWKQSRYQEKLLRQAIGEISRLELEQITANYNPVRSLGQRLRRMLGWN
jgi:hypothetical protein